MSTLNPSVKAKNMKIQVTFMSTSLQQKFTKKVDLFYTIHKIKKIVSEEIKIPTNKILLYYKNQALRENQNWFSEYISSKDQQPIIDYRLPKEFEENTGYIQEIGKCFKINSSTQHLIDIMLKKVQKSLLQQLHPKPSDFNTGTSGSYLIQCVKSDTSYIKNLAIFKPEDEEPFTPNNPKNYIGKMGSQSFRKGILSGESATREVAAYMLDHVTKFHGVPITVFVEFYHKNFKFCDASVGQPKRPKTGSLQQFVSYDEVTADLGSSSFDAHEVHKIAILDLRILNCDRNDENILAKRNDLKQYSLKPIDHGLSFPDTFEICHDWLSWYNWKQVKDPFSEDELSFIEKIDPKSDYEYLRDNLKFRPVCLRNFRVAEMFLKKAAVAKFTLHQIASLLYHENQNTLSKVGEVVKNCEEMYKIQKNAKSQIKYSYLEQIEENKTEYEEEAKELGHKPDLAKAQSEQIRLKLSRMQSNTSGPQENGKIRRRSSQPNLTTVSNQTIQPEDPFDYQDQDDLNDNSNKVELQARTTQSKNSSQLSQQNEEYDEEFYHKLSLQLDLLIKQGSHPMKQQTRSRFQSVDFLK